MQTRTDMQRYDQGTELKKNEYMKIILKYLLHLL